MKDGIDGWLLILCCLDQRYKLELGRNFQNNSHAKAGASKRMHSLDDIQGMQHYKVEINP